MLEKVVTKLTDPIYKSVQLSVPWVFLKSFEQKFFIYLIGLIITKKKEIVEKSFLISLFEIALDIFFNK